MRKSLNFHLDFIVFIFTFYKIDVEVNCNLKDIQLMFYIIVLFLLEVFEIFKRFYVKYTR